MVQENKIDVIPVQRFDHNRAIFEGDADPTETIGIRSRKLFEVVKPVPVSKPHAHNAGVASSETTEPSSPSSAVGTIGKLLGDLDLEVSAATQAPVGNSPQTITTGAAEEVNAQVKAFRTQARQDACTSPIPAKRAVCLPETSHEPVQQTLSYLRTQNKKRIVNRNHPETAFERTEPSISARPVHSLQQKFSLGAYQYGYSSLQDRARPQAAGYARGQFRFEQSPSRSAPSPGPSTVADRFDREIEPYPPRIMFPANREPVRRFCTLDEERELGQKETVDSVGSDEENDAAHTPRITSNITARRSRPPSTAPEVASHKRKGPAKSESSVTSFPLFLYDSSGLKSISDLPRDRKECLETALNGMYKQNPKRAITVTNPANSATYLDTELCLGNLVIRAKRHPLCPSANSCSACTNKEGRPCVRMKSSNGETVLVFYPRPADRRPSGDSWTQPRFWLG